MGATNNFAQNDLQMLGRRDYDINYLWGATVMEDQLDCTTLQFIAATKLQFQHASVQISTQDTQKIELSPKQKVALDIVLQHHNKQSATTPLQMIVQGTAGTGKSFLIDCIRKQLNISTTVKQNPLLVLAPTGVVSFNIQATTIHAGLRIPIREMHPLIGQPLMTLQEQLKHIKYILIDEMSFLGPKLLLKIDSCLRQAFPDSQHESFGGVSIILVGDLAQLPPVMDKPIYASHSTTLSLWLSFTTVVTLDTIFRQQGASIRQHQFKIVLHNIRNAQALQHDWQFLMCQTNATLTIQQKKDFNSSIHLFATNESARLHNRKMLKELNLPIALSLAKVGKQTNTEYDNNEQLPLEVLLSINQQVMLIANLWIEVGLVNGAIGLIKKIVYENNTKPPDLPKYVVVQFKDYNGPPWDIAHPKDIPILPITRGRRTQVPLTMSWAITIHKSQGLTLEKATIDIGNTEKQGLTFTAISRVKTIDGIRIEPPFSFERYSKLQNNAYTSIRKKEETHLQLLSAQTNIYST
ncbi:ATP-dependent DNA helicase pfh1-like [Cryptomeria japonica]|uniref:ATP-dependent DNA helicase pfh1-like n=1 Tax=Cryptomeria japonica TaxID=3369 RepID=UPI0027D9DDA6|nr:ATP-dependent DNA helicase pfh1-like [Cryptomeria japonica]